VQFHRCHNCPRPILSAPLPRLPSVNLPLGIFAILLIFGVLETCQPKTINREKIFTVRDRLALIDWVGSVICIGMVVLLLLPLQWGGITKSWDDATVIVLFCLSALLLGIFVLWEWRKGDGALVPFTMFRRRSQFGAASATFFIGLGLFIGVHPLPRFQAKGHSATRSGIDILPFMISVVACKLFVEALDKLGRYWHIITISPLIFSIGSGLLFTLSANSPTNQLIGYQILGHFNHYKGSALQNVFLAIHAEWAAEPHRIPQAVALCSLMQLTGGSVGIPIAGTIFRNKLKEYLAAYVNEIPSDSLTAVQQSVDAIFTLPPAIQDLVISAYIRSLNHVFLLGIPAGILASISAAVTKNYDLKARRREIS
ncbi:hypothetical protein DFH08DRAFT_1040174, partial [Mycena albidolilacea]